MASNFDLDDVQIEQVEPCYQGFCKVERYQLRHRLFDGGWSESMSRELYVRDAATCVLPYDPVSDQVVLIEQFRVGALAGRSPWLLELVAGMNDGQTPEHVARREAIEEADLQIHELEHICDYWVSPGGMSERVYLYCGRIDASLAEDGSLHGLAHEHEDIRVHVMPLDDALALIRNGGIDNAAALIALQWLALNRDELQQKWRANA